MVGVVDEYGFCPDCGTERLFEEPECHDGHGADCPERCCTHCGAAVLIDPPLPRIPEPRRRPLAA